MEDVRSVVQKLLQNKTPLHKEVFYLKHEKDRVIIEAAIQYTDSYNETVSSYVSNITTVKDGTHLSGFYSGLMGAVSNYAKGKQLLKDNVSITRDDVREGLVAAISIMLPQPQFEGPAQTKLMNAGIEPLVAAVTGEALISFFEKNPAVATRIVDKILLAARAAEAARKARELIRRKKAGGDTGLFN